MRRTTKPRAKAPRTVSTSRRNRELGWVDYSDEELLDLRLCDLGVRIEGTRLENRIAQLHDELADRGLRFRPHCWLSDEWFTPDGVPGIAIPFYLAHPRLERLERKQMLEVEGGTKPWCMRILRHEAGHAIDNAYRLGRRRSWQNAFGSSSEPYPEHYSPKPYSKSYVQHLDMWYAQAHPAEDFAETFAVWARPRSPWRSQYDGWPAIKKLQYVDRLMADVSQKKQQVTTRRHVDSVRTITKTLREHYEEKKERYGVGHPTFYDRDLLKLFSDAPEHHRNTAASAFLRKHRRYLRQAIGEWTGQYQYTIDQVLNEMIDRSRQLRLRLRRSERHTKRDSLVMLTVQTMNYLHGGHHRVAL
jgi:hypothetical protein